MTQKTEKPKLIENNLGSILENKKITKYKMSKDLKIHWNTVHNWTKADNMDSGDMRICADYLGVDVNEVFKI